MRGGERHGRRPGGDRRRGWRRPCAGERRVRSDGIMPMSTDEPSERPVLEYGSRPPEVTERRRTGVGVLSVLAGFFGLAAFGLGCGVVVVAVVLGAPAGPGGAIRVAGIYFAIAAMCAFAAVRWGRAAFGGRRGGGDWPPWV